eukprot:gnl/Chilomastix_cuspidata/5227.p1 GENE.gnl/Chilomastix_cuspidata/5227~~gnl/Chilomastix_cuspidata/5227.p1  ORF type:complete len:408 (-),score=124.27 gnl/Chilomastix_cuspidata/5227:142-1365(-)
MEEERPVGQLSFLEWRDLGKGLKKRELAQIECKYFPDDLPSFVSSLDEGRQKVDPWEFWKSIGSPTTCLAPMIKSSNIAFRLLCKRHGVQLSYTPMVNAGALTYNPDVALSILDCQQDAAAVPGDLVDRPLFLQLSGHSPDEFARACRYLRAQPPFFDAVDINFGCPQPIAGPARSFFGSYLLANWPLCFRIVRAVAKNAPAPATVKFRVFDDVATTCRFARLMVLAGAAVLCVHGRHPAPSRRRADVSWDAVRAVVRACPEVPVIANGGIWDRRAHEQCLAHTRCACTMAGQGLLANPALYEPRALGAAPRASLAVASEYVDIAMRVYGAHPSGHYGRRTFVTVASLCMRICGFALWNRFLPAERDALLRTGGQSYLDLRASLDELIRLYNDAPDDTQAPAEGANE